MIGHHSYAMGKKKKKYVMGVLGDSISAATFADTRVDEIPPSSDVRSAEDVQPFFEARKLEPQFLIENKRAYSWASGRSIDSHFWRLKNIIERKSDKTETLVVFNVAVPGNEAVHMKGQAERFIEALTIGDYESVKYITFMVGSNDACAEEEGGTPNDKMAKQLLEAFATLATIKQEERIKILISSVPKIPDLSQSEFLHVKTLGFLTCDQVRHELLKPCNRLTVWKTAEEYYSKMAVVDEKNQVLVHVMHEAQELFPSLEFFFSRKFYDATIQPHWLAADCFHPSSNGQQEISDLLWAEQPWF